MLIDAAQVKEATWLWAVKQTMEISKQQMAQTLQGVTAPSEPGKGTLLDVRV